MARTTLYMLRVCVVSNIYQSSFDDGRFCQHKRYVAAPGAATSNQFYSGFANFMSTPTDRTTHSLTYAYIHKHTHTRARLRTRAPTTSIRISCFDASPQPNGWFCVRAWSHSRVPGPGQRRPTGITQQPATTECGQQQLQLLCASPQSTRTPGAVPVVDIPGPAFVNYDRRVRRVRRVCVRPVSVGRRDRARTRAHACIMYLPTCITHSPADNTDDKCATTDVDDPFLRHTNA